MAGIAAWRYRALQVTGFLVAAGIRRLLSSKKPPDFGVLARQWSGVVPVRSNPPLLSRWAITYHPWYHNFEPALVNKCLAEAAALGAGYLRLDIRWKDLMPDGHVVDEGAWAWYDAYLNAALEWYGLRLLIVLSNPPDAVLHSDAALRHAAWKRYVDEVARRVRTRCDVYQLLNEPNNPVFRLFSLKEAAAAVVSGANILRGHNPAAQVAINILVGLWGWKSALKTILAHSGSAVDILGLDYYPGTWTASPRSDWSEIGKLLMEAKGNSTSLMHGRRFAILETGYSTNLPPWRNERQQTAYFQRLEESVKWLDEQTEQGGLALVSVHELCDADSRAFLDPEAHFGVLISNGLVRKPGFAELQRIFRSAG